MKRKYKNVWIVEWPLLLLGEHNILAVETRRTFSEKDKKM